MLRSFPALSCYSPWSRIWELISIHLISKPIGKGFRVIRPGCLEDYSVSTQYRIMIPHVGFNHLYVVTINIRINSILRELANGSSIDLASYVIEIFDIATNPLDLVLDGLHDEVNALKHIGDVVDSSFLHFKLYSCNIKVHLLIWRFSYKFNELSGQFSQRVLLTSSISGDVSIEKISPGVIYHFIIVVPVVVVDLVKVSIVIVSNYIRYPLTIDVISCRIRPSILAWIFCKLIDMLIILPSKDLVHYVIIIWAPIQVTVVRIILSQLVLRKLVWFRSKLLSFVIIFYNLVRLLPTPHFYKFIKLNFEIKKYKRCANIIINHKDDKFAQIAHKWMITLTLGSSCSWIASWVWFCSGLYHRPDYTLSYFPKHYKLHSDIDLRKELMDRHQCHACSDISLPSSSCFAHKKFLLASWRYHSSFGEARDKNRPDRR